MRLGLGMRNPTDSNFIQSVQAHYIQDRVILRDSTVVNTQHKAPFQETVIGPNVAGAPWRVNARS